MSAKLGFIGICISPFAHGQQERLTCERGLPMFIEKPVAVNLEQAEEIGARIIVRADYAVSGTRTAIYITFSQVF